MSASYPPVLDTATGDHVCHGCGVVVSSHHMVDAPEWYFSSDSRAGAPAPPSAPPMETRAQLDALDALHAGAASMHLPQTHVVVQAAREVLVHVLERPGACHVRSDNRGAVAAACLYVGFKLSNCERQLATVAAHCGVAMKAARKAYDAVCEALRDHACFPRVQRSRLEPKHVVTEFASKVAPGEASRLSARALALAAALEARGAQLGRQPQTVAAALVFRAARELGMDVPPTALRENCGVCPQVMLQADKQLDALLPERAVA